MSQELINETISAEELAEFTAVAAGFAADVPGVDWALLDEGDADAIERSWNGLCEIGFDRCAADEDAGGAGLGAGSLGALVEEIAVGDGGVALLMLLSNVAAVTLGESVGEIDQASRLVYVPNVGSRRRNAVLPRLKDGTLTGRTTFALGALEAGDFVVACHDGDDLALAHVSDGAAGLTVTAIDDQLGLGAARAARIDFDAVEVTQVGGRAEADHAEALLFCGITAIARGAARHSRELAQEYAENRYQGGTEIINHGAVRDMLARMSERELGMPQPAVPAGEREFAVALAGKISVTDAAVLSTIDGVQVFGGMGYMRETGAEKLMRDTKYCQVYPRPNWVARDELLELQR